MNKKATVLAGAIAWLFLASCGEPFSILGGGGAGGGASSSSSSSSASSGSSSSGSSSSSSGSTSSSSTSSSGSAGSPCTPSDPSTCGPGRYCATSNCMTGTCQVLPPTQGKQWHPVCGCNKLLYWNEDLAIQSGVAFRDTCSAAQLAQMKICDQSQPCNQSAGEYCNRDTDILPATCNTPDVAKGVCTKVPADCQGTDHNGFQCPSSNCQLACELIKSEVAWISNACTIN